MSRKVRLVPGIVARERGWHRLNLGRVLVVAATSANRSIVLSHRAMFDAAFRRDRWTRACGSAPPKRVRRLWFVSSMAVGMLGRARASAFGLRALRTCDLMPGEGRAPSAARTPDQRRCWMGISHRARLDCREGQVRVDWMAHPIADTRRRIHVALPVDQQAIPDRRSACGDHADGGSAPVGAADQGHPARPATFVDGHHQT